MTPLGFALAICYVPGWSGFVIPTGWILLSCILPLLLWERVEMGLAHWLGLGFLAYACASLAWTPVWEQGIWDLWLLAILAMAFRFKGNLDELLAGLALGIGISSILAVAQIFGFSAIYQAGPPYGAGLFVNTSILGETAALVTIGLASVRLCWPIPLVAPAVALSGSRTAILALAVTAFMACQYKVAIAVAAGAVLIYFSRLPNGIDHRLAIWQDSLSGLTLFGRGAGSFFTTFPIFASRTDLSVTRPEAAHNDYLELVYQYGLGVVPLLAAVAIALLSQGPERYLFIGFLVIALFGFPMRSPIEGFLGALAMGRLCSRWSLVRSDRAAGGRFRLG